MAFWDLESTQLEPFRAGIMSRAEIGENLTMVCTEIAPRMEDLCGARPDFGRNTEAFAFGRIIINGHDKSVNWRHDNFRPITPMTMRTKDKMRIIPKASPKKIIPMRKVPAAPIPVQTA